MRLLLIDRGSIAKVALRATFETLGRDVDVVHAETVPAALSLMAGDQAFDVVLYDLESLDDAALGDLGTAPARPPIVALSPGELQDAERAITLGVTAILPKTLETVTICSALLFVGEATTVFPFFIANPSARAALRAERGPQGVA